MTCSQWQLCSKWLVNIVNEKQCICCFHKALCRVQYFWITFITSTSLQEASWLMLKEYINFLHCFP